jgi:hypothetical protein
MMLKTLALTILVVAACGGGGNKPEPKKPEPAPVTGIKKMPTPTCAATSDTMTVVILASNDAMPSDTEVKEIKTILKTRCEADGWSDRAKECLATMESEADADGCASMLTAEQRNKIIADERIKLGGAKRPEAPGGGGAAKPADKKPNMAAVLKDLEKFRDKMCACKDSACGGKVNSEFMTWAQELEKLFGPDFKPDDKDQEQLGKLVMEFGQCYSKLVTADDDAAAPPPPPPPPPKAKKGTSRGGTPKKPVPKSSDPCMGGE